MITLGNLESKTGMPLRTMCATIRTTQDKVLAMKWLLSHRTRDAIESHEEDCNPSSSTESSTAPCGTLGRSLDLLNVMQNTHTK
jgi:hypothetical protein